MLNEAVKKKNRQFFNDQISPKFFGDEVILENGKNDFLSRCEQAGIELFGLSSKVKGEFFAFTPEPTQVQFPIGFYFPGSLFNHLKKLIDDEKEHQKNLFRVNSDKALDNGRHTDRFISNYLEDGAKVPKNYGWLQVPDVMRALEPLRKLPEVYIYEPVAQIDKYTEAAVQEAFDEGVQIVFIPQNKNHGSHWTLTYYTDRNSKHNFDPSGAGGRCGDRLIAKVYEEVQKKFCNVVGTLVKESERLGDKLRQQTVELIQGVFGQVGDKLAALENYLYPQWNDDLDVFLDTHDAKNTNDDERDTAWKEFVSERENQYQQATLLTPSCIAFFPSCKENDSPENADKNEEVSLPVATA